MKRIRNALSLCLLFLPPAWLFGRWNYKLWRNPFRRRALFEREQRPPSSSASNSTFASYQEAFPKLDLEAAFRIGANDLEQQSQQPRRRSNPSFERSVEQVHALFDLSIQTENESVPVSSGFALKALEGLVTGIRRDVDFLSLQDVQLQLNELEQLFLRLDALEVSPTLQTVENMWLIYQHFLQSSHDKTFLRELIDKTAILLQKWERWASQPLTELHQVAPPFLYVQRILEVASKHRLNMTDTLWDLYDRLGYNESQPSRGVHDCVLDILSDSGQEWQVRQCQVLQQLCLLNQGSQDIAHTRQIEFTRALHASTEAGRVADVAWLSRTLMKACNDTETIDTTRSCLFEALYKSNEDGSLLYMQRLLLSTDHHSTSLDEDSLKLLLQKCSRTRSPGLGKRAESILRQAKKLLKSGWQPDVECIHYVVSAYLQHEPSISMHHVAQADRFVRSCVADFGLHKSADNGNSTNFRIFDALLQAYSSISSDQTNGSALRAADALFRFFLLQHRDGRISSEVPDHVHLERILDIWSRHPNATLAKERATEYSTLMRALQQRGVASPKSMDTN